MLFTDNKYTSVRFEKKKCIVGIDSLQFIADIFLMRSIPNTYEVKRKCALLLLLYYTAISQRHYFI